jgi:hypothetical protein
VFCHRKYKLGMVASVESDVENLIEVLDGEKEMTDAPSMHDGACSWAYSWACLQAPFSFSTYCVFMV